MFVLFYSKEERKKSLVNRTRKIEKMAIIVVTGSTGGSRRDASISSLTGGDGPTSGGGEDQQEKDSGCDPSDLWMLSPSAASVLCGHLPITASHSGSHSRHSSSHLHHHQVRRTPPFFSFID